MSSADQKTPVSICLVHSWPAQYGLALVTVAAATLLRYPLAELIGDNLPFVLFYPSILFVAWLAGPLPGVFTVFLSVVSAEYFFFGHMSPTALGLPRNGNGLLLFSMVGVAMGALPDIYRRRAKRLQGFEKALENVEDMIVVVDRDYRYVIANHAFLKYRGIKKEDLVGRQLSDVLRPGAFEKMIKEKLDECFEGIVVRFEMRYEYPALGKRHLFISCFPIAGFNGIDRVACVLQDLTEQKEAERSLKLFRTLIDQSNDAVEVVDPETLRFLDVNEKACQDLGYTREELLSMTVLDIDLEIDEAGCTVIDKLLSSGFVVREAIHRRKDGSTFPVESSMKFVQLDRAYVVVVSRDISDRRQAEAALRENEDRYRDLVEHSQDLVCTHDLEGRILSMNAAPALVLGYEVAELMNMPMREIVAPERRQEFDAYLARIKATGEAQGLLCVVTRSGERRIWEYRNTLRAEGVPSPIVRGMAHDITERTRAEGELRRSEQRYRLLFEKNVAGVAIANMNGELVDCNDGWAHMLGYGAADEIRGRQVTEFYFDVAERAPLLEKLKREGAFFSREMRLRRKDGTPVWVLFNCALVADPDAGAARLQTTAIDITERKLAEEALCRREADYRRFVAQSSEGIFREELDTPLAIDLPEDDLIHHIMHDSYFAECNDALARMYGFTTGQELVGKRLTEMLVADDARNIELTREYIHSGFKVIDRESHELDIHGQPKVIRNSLIGIVENGKLARTWGIQRDVTEQVKLEEARSQAEEALQLSEAHFRLLVEQASDGIFIADAQGKYIDVNSAGAEMLGYTRDEILRFTIADIIASDDASRLPSEINRFATGATVLSEWKFRRKDGSLFPGEVCGKQLPDGRLQGILRDISERRQAEELMRRNEERFRVALKDSPIMVFNQDQDLRYTWIYNPQLYWERDAIGKTDEQLIGTKRAARLVELKRRVLKTGIALREEVAISNGRKSHAFDITIEPLFDGAGKIIGITGASMDIARLREMTDRLQDARDRLIQEKSYLESEIQTELGFEEIIGQSSSLRKVLNDVRVVAATDSTVLLLGETGTGKELVARSVHSLSARRNNTFVKLNCAAVPSGLLESELFGHEKGAFTGAVSQKLGRIELADKGTLFLDEIGELPLELQPKLLRVLQDREFERLGGVQTLHVDVRIVSATNRDLQQDIADRKFREDLYYRLNVFPIELPALRERRSDIPVLIRHFVKKHAARMRKQIDRVPDETMARLENWSWPGNVRELENMIERMIIMSKDGILAAPPMELEGPEDVNEDNLKEMKREHLIRVLRETGGILSGTDGAANRLGLKRTTLQSMLKRHGIELQNYRRGNGAWGHDRSNRQL